MRLKFNPLPEVLRGKRVVVVDDSIVRGTTTAPIVGMLRRAGAREVHMRIPRRRCGTPATWASTPGAAAELIAATHTVDEIRRPVGADSLGYLSRKDCWPRSARDGRGAAPLHRLLRRPLPDRVPIDVDKYVLERG